jgi:phosphonate ABC transporter permease subunit PhnE
MKSKKSPLQRYLVVFVSVLAFVIVYAYGFSVTKVNLEETKSETRQTQLVRIIRKLARPNLFEYDQEEFVVSSQIMVPCPDSGFEPEIDTTGAYLVIEEKCADSEAEIHVSGYAFDPYTDGTLSFIPPSGVKLNIGNFTTNGSGEFELVANIPKGRTSAEVQEIQAVTRHNIGNPHVTTTAKDTWSKIIETVFMALLATTIGTIIAIPLSFFAARNLMEDILLPIISVSTGIILMPFGFVLGAMGGKYALLLSTLVGQNTLISVAIVVVLPILIYMLFKWSMPQVELEKPTLSIRILRIFAILVMAFMLILVLFQVSALLMGLGAWLVLQLGTFAFLGKFISDIGQILNMMIIAVAALAGLGVFNSIGSKFGQLILKKSPKAVIGLLNYLLSMAAGVVIALMLGGAVNWLYEIGNPLYVYYLPAAAGAIIGLIITYTHRETGIIPVGMVIYYVSRTIFNALRSIEALVMAIIFVVWVGIGPFAGALALSLHTIAALAKLYSEQVESIMEGPIEAVKATGANQLQTIVYAVVPQIIPPYISFTMYRWDINVRMSTIIGFAGGGGIGFLLQQNINLLQYRDASVQMFAIAIVVASMDYISSQLRERVI